MSVLVILLKCKAVIHLEEAVKAYAKGEFWGFLLPPFLSLWMYTAVLYYSSLSRLANKKIKNINILKVKKSDLRAGWVA